MYDGSYILVVAPLIEYLLVVVPSSFSNIFCLFELHVYSLILNKNVRAQTVCWHASQKCF